jgi:hypothetical protein
MNLTTPLQCAALATLLAIPSSVPAQAAHRRASAVDGVSQAREAATTSSLAVGVDRTGIVRVRYEELLSAGFPINDVPVAQLALLRAGTPVAIRVDTGASKGFMGDGGFFEFLGDGAASLWTATNVYQLVVDPSRASRMAEDATAPSADPSVQAQRTTRVEIERDWSPSAPNGDPWFDEMVLAYGSPRTAVRTFELAETDSGQASLKVDLWGVTDWPAGADHHVRVALNGMVLGDSVFDGLTPLTLTFDASGAVRTGTNTFELTVLGDTGQPWDMVALDGFEVTATQRLRPVDGSIEFSGAARSFSVADLQGAVVAYAKAGRKRAATFLRGAAFDSAKAGASYLVPGSPDATTYLVARADRLVTATLSPWTEPVSFPGKGTANWIAITHPEFATGLAPLVARRQAEGFTTRVVTTNEIYSRYTGGNVDPEAIRKFVRDARTLSGVEFVVLVGGASFDPTDRLQLGRRSFLPTNYVRTGAQTYFAPSDEAFGDLDRNGVPEIAVGRLPARDAAELATMVANTLAYRDQPRPLREATFVGDAGWGFMSMLYSSTLGPDWTPSLISYDDVGSGAIAATVNDSLRNGPALTHYLGHAAPAGWGQPAFLDANAISIDPAAAPTVLVQAGCWATYLIDPRNATLTQRLMASRGGAAVVIGPSSLVGSDTMGQLDEYLLTRLVPGATVGTALLQAKTQMAAYFPGATDVYLGVNYLGDPAVRVP